MLEPNEIGKILLDYFAGTFPDWQAQSAYRPRLFEQLAVYLDLLLKWNGRTNLSAIREPEAIVRRHFGESLFAASFLEASGSLLDLGSGAGFPGIPVQLWRPELRVTLAESQGKKSAFLREVVRVLGLEMQVWGGRAEELAPGRTFDAVIMRAVDTPGRALATAFELSLGDVWLLGSGISEALPERVGVVSRVALPGSDASYLFRLRR